MNAQERGRLGGRARAARTSPEERSRDASAAANARWHPRIPDRESRIAADQAFLDHIIRTAITGSDGVIAHAHRRFAAEQLRAAQGDDA